MRRRNERREVVSAISFVCGFLFLATHFAFAAVDCTCDAVADNHCPLDPCCKAGCQPKECNHKDANGDYDDNVGCDGYNCGSSNPPCNKFCSNSNPQYPCGGPSANGCSCLTATDGTPSARSCKADFWDSSDCGRKFCKKAWPKCGSANATAGNADSCDCDCGGKTYGADCHGGTFTIGGNTYYCGYDHYNQTGIPPSKGCAGSPGGTCCGGCWHQGVNPCKCWDTAWINQGYACLCGSGCQCSSDNTRGGFKLAAKNCSVVNGCELHCTSKSNEVCNPVASCYCDGVAGNPNCKWEPTNMWGYNASSYRLNCKFCTVGSFGRCDNNNQGDCPMWSWQYITW